MTRGTASFDASILKKLRASRKVDGRLLSAAELARLLKTSKARVLAYEQGTSVPEPKRVAQMAQVFKVHPRELYQARTGKADLIKDLRCYAGLTAAELAAAIGVSRTTYRDVERLAILPARDDGTLPLKIASKLGLPLGMVHRALDRHPATEERRTIIAGLLAELFQRAEVQHHLARVEPDDETLLKIAEQLRRPAAMVSRLVNYDIGRYRDLVRRHAVAQVNVAYAQTPRAAQVLSREIDELAKEIKRRPYAAASAQLKFLSEAMTSHQWRTVVSLMVPHPVQFSAEVFTALQKDHVWEGLHARGFIELDLEPATASVTVHFSPVAWESCAAQRRLYECLYPRIPVARPPVRRPYERRPHRKDTAAADILAGTRDQEKTIWTSSFG
ncbi:helix-turn-helix domain-containing protein [Streptomyces sp. SID2563]|uniref:helix-turn-helix domain-containing protein n=1 Tax=Streptomyces sp. SID2563 TaxID=2690255 RepID=UPI001370303F|nr:helix-turn-helix domain-containing protein [Streptomyces sp. SID2563]